jgi:hypothetical protein
MKKQCLVIMLLLSCAHSAKSTDLTQLFAGLTLAATTIYGIHEAQLWQKPSTNGSPVRTCGQIEGNLYGVDVTMQWGKPDHNAPGIFTTVGNIIGTTGLGALQTTNVAGVLSTMSLLFPSTRDVVIPAATVGFVYIAGNKLLLGAHQKNKPTNVNIGSALVLSVAGLGTLYKINAIPGLNQMVDRALGRKPTPLFYRLIGY